MNDAESWMNSKWRPAMGWTYMAICILDFAIFPIAWSILQAFHNGQITNQWDPLTLKGAGLFHMAMGAVLGITAWSRGQEKIAGVNNATILPSVPTTPSISSPNTGWSGSSSSPNQTINTRPELKEPEFRNTRND